MILCTCCFTWKHITLSLRLLVFPGFYLLHLFALSKTSHGLPFPFLCSFFYSFLPPLPLLLKRHGSCFSDPSYPVWLVCHNLLIRLFSPHVETFPRLDRWEAHVFQGLGVQMQRKLNPVRRQLPQFLHGPGLQWFPWEHYKASWDRAGHWSLVLVVPLFFHTFP